MKYNDIIKSATANLMRNKARTILTMIAIFIGTFTITLVAGLNIGVNAYINDQIEAAGGENLIVISPEDMTGLRQYNPEAPTEGMDLAAIGSIEGVVEVVGVTNLFVDYIVGESSTRYELPVVGTSHDTLNIQLEAGDQLRNEISEFEILLASSYVEPLGFFSNEDALNQRITLATPSASGERTYLEVTIVGIREPSLVLYGHSMVNYPLEIEINRINEIGLPVAMQGQVFSAGAELIGNRTAEEMDTIRESLHDLGYIGLTIYEQFGAISDVMNAITAVLVLFGAISLLAASFGIINTLYMSVGERTREVGLMKAMGLSRFKVFMIFSWEAALIGFIGSLVGIVKAVGVGMFVNQLAAESFLAGLPGLTLIQFTMPIVVVIILLIMFIAFLAGTLPASRASKLDPITALRTE